MDILFKDDFISIQESLVDNCLEIIGIKVNPDEDLFIKHIREILHQIENTGSKKIILCLEQINFIPSDFAIVREFLPKLKSLGVKQIANVIGNSQEIHDFYNEKNKPFEMLRKLFKMEVKSFEKIEQARDWLLED